MNEQRSCFSLVALLPAADRDVEHSLGDVGCDAVHATLPHLAQGDCMAIENAAVLTRRSASRPKRMAGQKMQKQRAN